MRIRRRGGDDDAVRIVLVATDLSETASRAVRFAAEMASRYEAELVVLRVLVGSEVSRTAAVAELEAYVQGLDGERKRAAVISGEDPADAIVDAARRENADALVVEFEQLAATRNRRSREVWHR